MEGIRVFLPLLIQLAFWFMERFVAANSQDAESRRIFLELANLLRQKGIRNVKSRFEAESQVQAGESVWNDRESKQGE